jgi:NADH:ubiquinone oxidoreductase subunit 3 (subunit A)
MPNEIPFLLPAIFGISILIALVIYFAGRHSKSFPEGSMKTAPYACGENMPAQEMRVDLNRFLIFAVYFLIFDVLAFTMATSYDNLGVMPVVYSLVLLMSVAMLVFTRRRT